MLRPIVFHENLRTMAYAPFHAAIERGDWMREGIRWMSGSTPEPDDISRRPPSPHAGREHVFGEVPATAEIVELIQFVSTGDPFSQSPRRSRSWLCQDHMTCAEALAWIGD